MRTMKGQYGIYGIIAVLVGLILWSAFNPTIELTVSNGTAAMNAGTMEAIVSPLIPTLLPIVIIYMVVVFSGIRR